MVAVVVVAYGLVSRLLERTPLTVPLAFTAAGMAAGGLGLVEQDLTGGPVLTLLELTLVVVLFSDAARIDLGAVRRTGGTVPLRLLGVGMPLTIGLGVLAAAVLLGGLEVWEGAIIAAVLAQHEGAPAWLLANLGDSRAYRVEGGSLEQVTVDHSVVQELVDTGLITEAAAAEHPERHVITRSLGGNQRSEPDLFVLPLAAAPRLVLCSDGISGMLDHEQMRGVLAADADPGRAAEALLAAALDAGGRDNATVVVVDALTDPAPDTAADAAAVGAETPTDVDLEQRLGVLP